MVFFHNAMPPAIHVLRDCLQAWVVLVFELASVVPIVVFTHAICSVIPQPSHTFSWTLSIIVFLAFQLRAVLCAFAASLLNSIFDTLFFVVRNCVT
jgi:hypothetical protein